MKIFVWPSITSQFKITKAMMDDIAINLHFSILNLILMMFIFIYGIISMVPISLVHMAACAAQDAAISIAYTFGIKED